MSPGRNPSFIGRCPVFGGILLQLIEEYGRDIFWHFTDPVDTTRIRVALQLLVKLHRHDYNRGAAMFGERDRPLLGLIVIAPEVAHEFNSGNSVHWLRLFCVYRIIQKRQIYDNPVGLRGHIPAP
ncbi:hypothetical protein KL86PLE_40341 [uncultured Pleomorphomonas sp.]|uniref:Uncharacterized protein n=1 Tax=uncultured Pleomorphomonas sp. TaxID=442121 RepID=A0A212LG42_9HYPH|nr:hypothetical protein KL86PLE_40341 [uncultured Pleomorphomonas sp.]